ncbi:MAG: hypothetical protein AMS24_00305 [Chlamydiae bacterium SM23_39]|nr:MAG: hypothetical protein AMS24_00305 [Chlamydiae bacterium SM23_39]
MDNNKKDNNFIDDFLTISSSNSLDPKVLLENSKIFYEKLMAKVQELLEKKDFEGLQEVFKSITTQLQGELERIANQYGIPKEELQKMMNNPMDISKDLFALKDLQEEKDKKIKKNKSNKIKKNWTSV